MLQELHLDLAQETDRITSFVRDSVTAAGFHRVVLGVSGGVDSALVAALCVRALGAENVLGLIMPSEISNPSSTEHGMLVIDQLGMPSEFVDITPMYRPLLDREPAMGGGRLGNIMSRLRMVTLYDRSASFSGLVMGTGNRTEWLLGYFTLYGDSAAALRPIAHLYKVQVRELSTYLGLPDVVVTKAPSADLWQGQTDEGDLGFSYDDADQILFLLTEQSLSVAEIASRGFSQATVEAVQRVYRRTAFKRAPVPVLDPVWQSRR
ncbi:MAG: NAD+ synthase [Anaerolineae bacterium]|jgi:NAD+ synthase|nr:NAD+ synthase [Chloroflexota bacterium]